MTKLIVTPIDMSAQGSFKLRRKLFGAFTAMKDAEAGQNGIAVMAAYASIEAMILDRLETDDGTSVADALEMVSAEQFDQLIGGLLGEPTVPNSTSTL